MALETESIELRLNSKFELQDGCLSLEEFLTAMHLVVLKRNNIDVPETLPPILKPAYLRQRLSRANRKVITKYIIVIFEKRKNKAFSHEN